VKEEASKRAFVDKITSCYGIHGVISLKMELFINTDLRTSNPTNL
jgi:hypothetical protein